MKLKKTISSDKIRLECTQQSMTFSLITLTKATLKLAINYIPENTFIWTFCKFGEYNFVQHFVWFEFNQNYEHNFYKHESLSNELRVDFFFEKLMQTYTTFLSCCCCLWTKKTNRFFKKIYSTQIQKVLIYSWIYSMWYIVLDKDAIEWRRFWNVENANNLATL